MKLIVGLGNPGSQYDGTRHNVGFDVIDVLASRWRIDLKVEKFHGWFGQGMIAGDRAILLKPTTFMNRSGQAVLSAGRFYKLELDELLVVADDLALPLGRIRFRMNGSAGGHNGLQNVLDRLGSSDWCRLRVGIDSAAGNAVSHVLGRFEEQAQVPIEAARHRAADAAECWIGHGPGVTMNRFNADPPAA